MPTYCYKCQNCNAVLEFRHSYKEVRTVCTECNSPALIKILNTPIKILSNKANNQAKTGSVVNSTIKEIKNEIKKERENLKKREST